MTIKIILCLSILAFTSGVGYFLAGKYRQRKLFFTQFLQFNERFLREISYAKRPVKEFITAYSYKGEFAELLNKYLSELGKENVEFMKYVEETAFLEKDEPKTVLEYFESIGKGNSDSQKRYFTNANGVLTESFEKANAEYKKNADLYVKLGVLIGLAIIIIIV